MRYSRKGDAYMWALVLPFLAAACGSGTEAGESSSEGTTEVGRVSVGTTVTATLNQELGTDENEVGDSFSATVSQPVASGGSTLIPSGSTVRGKVTEVRKAADDQPARLRLNFESIQIRGTSYPLTATLTNANPESRKKMTGKAKKIGGGAAAGAIVGGLIGGGAKGAAAGAGAGAAVGTAITLGTRDTHAYLPQGSAIDFRVDQALTVTLGS